ncbi:hypothetical protein JHK86_043223 [Glycine max]|nr:hypothetical protein JHK86_043223 [Glycine max]
MESRKRARTEDIPSSSTLAPLPVTVGQDVQTQLPLVRPNEAAPPEPTHVQVNSEPANPQSPVVNPPSLPELEAVSPSPTLIVISDASSDEPAALPDSPTAETADPPVSPIGGIANLSYSSSGEVVALTNSPV